MKFSEQWLREWVNPAVDTQQLAHQLTMAGLEVDAIDAVAAEFEQVVVGEVMEISPHPDADKLRVCQVNVGQADLLNIVCGATNVAVGLKVPAALIGAKLPGGLKIKKSKLRGVESCGMLCSAKELGMAEQAEGLMVLPDDAPVGEDIRQYLKLEDVTIELGLTPNRGDCLSIAGIAREVGVLNHTEVSVPAMKTVSVKLLDKFDVQLDAAEACPVYLGRVIRGIDNAIETPVWMQERLRRCGVRSLGPVVDVTNYVLLELGQPMHAFDLARLEGGIVVRYAKPGENLKLLDEQEITLDEEALVIADQKKAVALAGVMGGLDTAVQNETKDIFLECAYFNPLAIAGKARKYGLHTDSSHRFERGVSPELQQKAIERATELLLDIVGGKAGPIVKAQSNNHLPIRQSVVLRLKRIEKVLGMSIPEQEVLEILRRLGMEVHQQTDGWKVTPPAFRFDIELEEDLIEEVGRIVGYDQLPNTRAQGSLTMKPRSETRLSLRRIRHFLVDQGYQEAITYSFVSPEMQALLAPSDEVVSLSNPISSDMATMRTTLWSGLIQAMQHNLNRQQNRISLFECGLRFIQQDSELKQEMMVAGLRSGDSLPEQWGTTSRQVDFFDIKRDVEALLGLSVEASELRFEAAIHLALHPGQSASIQRNGQQIGYLGALHPQLARKLGLSQDVMLFEISLAGIQGTQIPSFETLSKFPAIRRDLALVLDEEISAQQVNDVVKKAAPGSLKNIELFDVYTGEGIDSGRKSLALGLTLQDLSRTLTDNEVDDAITKIVGTLQMELGATLRD